MSPGSCVGCAGPLVLGCLQRLRLPAVGAGEAASSSWSPPALVTGFCTDVTQRVLASSSVQSLVQAYSVIISALFSDFINDTSVAISLYFFK